MPSSPPKTPPISHCTSRPPSLPPTPTTPGGCIGGGGQPRSKDRDILAQRQAALYGVDERKVLRRSHENPVVRQLYDDFLERPNSHKVGRQAPPCCGVGTWHCVGPCAQRPPCERTRQPCGPGKEGRRWPLGGWPGGKPGGGGSCVAACSHTAATAHRPRPLTGPRAAAHPLRALRPGQVRPVRPPGGRGPAPCGRLRPRRRPGHGVRP